MQRYGLRHFTAYGMTAILYLFIIGVLYYTKTDYFVSSKAAKEKVIQMSLSTFVPKVVPLPHKVVEEVVSEPLEEQRTKKEVKEEAKVENIVSKPVVNKVRERVVSKKSKVEPKRRPHKRLVKKSMVKKKKRKRVKKRLKPKRTKRVATQQISSKQSKSTPAQRHQFWSALRAKIDSHKLYPRIAKKRRMEGAVKIRFTILANGNIGHIALTGPKIFYHSAQNAVKRAFPIETKNAPVALPTTINLTLHYQIR